VRDKDRMGDGWCYWKGLVKAKLSPLEKGVLSTKKEERPDGLKAD